MKMLEKVGTCWNAVGKDMEKVGKDWRRYEKVGECRKRHGEGRTRLEKVGKGWRMLEKTWRI